MSVEDGTPLQRESGLLLRQIQKAPLPQLAEDLAFRKAINLERMEAGGRCLTRREANRRKSSRLKDKRSELTG